MPSLIGLSSLAKLQSQVNELSIDSKALKILVNNIVAQRVNTESVDNPTGNTDTNAPAADVHTDDQNVDDSFASVEEFMDDQLYIPQVPLNSQPLTTLQ